MKEKPHFTDQSQTHRTYLIVYGTVGIVLFGYIIMTIRYILNTGSMPWLDIITELIILVFLVSVAFARTTYELDDKDLVVYYSSPLRTRTFRIPYADIDGAFHFKVEPMKTIAYKHTYRAYGSLDRRDIWSLVFNIPGTDHVARLLMKASDEFWTEFGKRVPGRIRVSQEEVLKHAFRHISGIDNPKNKARARKAAAEDEALEAEELERKDTAVKAADKQIPREESNTPEITQKPKQADSMDDIRKELKKDDQK